MSDSNFWHGGHNDTVEQSWEDYRDDVEAAEERARIEAEESADSESEGES